MIIRLGSSCTTCSLAAASSSPSSLCISAHTILLCLGSCILHLDSYIHMHLGMGTCTCMVQCTLCIWTLALASGHLQMHLDTWTPPEEFYTLAQHAFNFSLCTWIHLQRSRQHQQHWVKIGLVKEVCVEKNMLYTLYMCTMCAMLASGQLSRQCTNVQEYKCARVDAAGAG